MAEPANPHRKPQQPQSADARPTQPPPPPPAEDAAAELWEDVNRIPRRLKHAARPTSKKSQGGLVVVAIALFLILAAVVALVAAWSYRQAANAPTPPDFPPEPAVSAAEPTTAAAQGEPPASANSSTVPQSPAKAQPSGPPPERKAKDTSLPKQPAAEPSAAKPSSPPLAAFTRAMNQAKAALAARDFPRATAALEHAERNASGSAQTQQVKRLRALDRELKRFFELVRAGLKKLEPAAELHFGDTIASVTEVGPESIALFIERDRQDYTLATMPPAIAMAIAALAGSEESPQGKVLWGALYAVDPNGDRTKAESLWRAAGKAGQDVSELLPLAQGAELSIERAEIPAGDALSAANEQVAARFATETAAAKSAQRKARLATTMLAAADNAETAAGHYALAEQARTLAVAGSDAATALAAADALGKWFVIDALPLKTQTLNDTLAASKTTTAAKEVAAAAIVLVAQAEKSQRPTDAAALAETAYAAARKARDPQLLKRATLLREEFKQGK